MFRHKAFSSISFSLSSKVTSTHLKMSADETTGFHGRFGSTQYTPKKPVKLGIKVFTLADANTGYLLNMLALELKPWMTLIPSLPPCQC